MTDSSFISFQRGVFVAGLREEIVNSPEQVLKLIESGEGAKLNIEIIIFWFGKYLFLNFSAIVSYSK